MDALKNLIDWQVFMGFGMAVGPVNDEFADYSRLATTNVHAQRPRLL